MEFRGDLTCMVCSHFLGVVSGIKTGPGVSLTEFIPGPRFTGTLKTTAPSRCDKCGGHLYLDDVEIVNTAPAHKEAA